MRICTAVIAAALSLSASLANPAVAQTATPVASLAPPEGAVVRSDPFFGITTYRIWSGTPRGAVSGVDDQTPSVTVVKPREGHSNGSAVVLAPGGAYIGLAADLEGEQVASWFAAHGVTAFVLKYRVGKDAKLPIPFYDGERAMRFARTYADFFGVDPDRIGMMGFSAGGHLAATTATHAKAGQADAADPVERASSRPDFLILGYPWLEGMSIDPETGTSQYCAFMHDPTCDPKAFARYRPVEAVTADMPPTFIYHTTNDDLVPVSGSIRFYEKLHELGVPVEMHLFADGPHGTGLGGSDPALSLWPDALAAWMRALGAFDKE